MRERYKQRRQHISISCTSPEAYRPLFTVPCHANVRRVKLLRRPLRYGRDSEKRQAASFFCRLFSPCIDMRECVCVCSASPLSRIKEKRGGSIALLSAFCSTGFLLERGKDASCLKPGILFEHVLSSSSIFLLRRGTGNDTLK